MPQAQLLLEEESLYNFKFVYYIETAIYLQILKIMASSGESSLQTHFIQFHSFYQSYESANLIIRGRGNIIFLILSCKYVVGVGDVREDLRGFVAKVTTFT